MLGAKPNVLDLCIGIWIGSAFFKYFQDDISAISELQPDQTEPPEISQTKNACQAEEKSSQAHLEPPKCPEMSEVEGSASVQPENTRAVSSQKVSSVCM